MRYINLRLTYLLTYSFTDTGRLSRPWCEVAPAKIRTHNCLIASPALYHTANSALITFDSGKDNVQSVSVLCSFVCSYV